MVAPESSADSGRPPAWVDAAKLVGDVGNTVLHGARRDLSDRRARWALTVVQAASTVGAALLSHRYPSSSADQRVIAAALKDARARGELDIAELRRDPAFRAAQARLTRRTVRLLIYGVSAAVAHRILLAELKRRRVRRPHLVAGIALATAQTAYRVGTLVAEKRQRENGQP